jgi:hypothetical protein
MVLDKGFRYYAVALFCALAYFLFSVPGIGLIFGLIVVAMAAIGLVTMHAEEFIRRNLAAGPVAKRSAEAAPELAANLD